MPDNALNIVFLDRDTISDSTTIRTPACEHTLKVYGRTEPEQVAERIADADIVILNKVQLREESLAQAPRLKMVAVAATGTDNVDIAACHTRGIVVSNIRGYANTTVPEHVFALIFALRRSIVPYSQAVKAGRWQDARQYCFFDYPISDLAGSTLGIVGEGSLGQAVAAIGRAFGLKVLFAARKGGSGQGSLYTPFNEMLARSDIITLHCPLNEHTRNLIDAPEFARMERRPLIINTARGGLVNEQALGHALRSGQISGAGFDVTMPEPPPADNPLMQLLDLPNFILTPHVAWASAQAVQALANQLIDNVDAFVRGEPRNVVQPKA